MTTRSKSAQSTVLSSQTRQLASTPRARSAVRRSGASSSPVGRAEQVAIAIDMYQIVEARRVVDFVVRLPACTVDEAHDGSTAWPKPAGTPILRTTGRYGTSTARSGRS